MFKSRFFLKVYASTAALVLLTAAVVGTSSIKQVEEALFSEKFNSLKLQCQSLAPRVREDLARRAVSPGDWAHTVEDSPVRVTLILASGEVLFDSRNEAAEMVNHLDREEVQEARRNGWGQAVRESETMGRRFIYVAQASGQEGSDPEGFVRLALEVRDIDQQVAVMRRRLIISALLGALAAVGIGALVTRRITHPLRKLRGFAEDLRDGRYGHRVGDLPRDEIGLLGDTLDQLGVEITRRINELSAEEARLRAMLAGMVEGVIAVDEGDEVVFSNRAARELLGTAELIGRLWDTVRVAGLDALLESARASDEAARKELSFSDSTGRELIVEAKAHRFTADGGVGVVIVLHDQTELRHLERVRRDFVANVSHELKTPLTSIRGFVETLISGALYDDKNNVRFLEKIESNVGRLTHLVADLLSLARIESAEHGLSFESIELCQMVHTALSSHEQRATARGIACRVESAVEPIRVHGDRESMIQVIDNLLDNAIKYTTEGEVVVSLREDGGRGVLEVRDTGIGIPLADLERVFERFYRVDKARSRELGGTGLGLSIVKHLVASMGGDVAVESEVGVGTSFTVALPLVEPHLA